MNIFQLIRNNEKLSSCYDTICLVGEEKAKHQIPILVKRTTFVICSKYNIQVLLIVTKKWNVVLLFKNDKMDGWKNFAGSSAPTKLWALTRCCSRLQYFGLSYS